MARRLFVVMMSNMLVMLPVNVSRMANAFEISDETSVFAAVVTIVDRVGNSTATGFIVAVERDGWLILTNEHAVDGGGRIDVVVLPNTRAIRYPAVRLATDSRRDLALLKIYTQNSPPAVLPVAPLGSDSPKRVLCFGQRDGIVVTTESRFLGIEHMTIDRLGVDGQFLRISPRQEPGSSGAPVVVPGDDGQPNAIAVHWGRSGSESRAVSTTEMHAFLDDAGYASLYHSPSPDPHKPSYEFSQVVARRGKLGKKVDKRLRKSGLNRSEFHYSTRINGSNVEVRGLSVSSSSRFVIRIESGDFP